MVSALSYAISALTHCVVRLFSDVLRLPKLTPLTTGRLFPYICSISSQP